MLTTNEGSSTRGCSPFLLAATVAVAAFFGCFIVVAQWPSSLSFTGAGSAAISEPHLSGLIAETMVFALLPLLALATPWRRQFGVMPPRPPTTVRLIQATSLVVLAQTSVGVTASYVASVLTPTRDTSAAGAAAHTFGERLVVAAHAAVQEEVLDIVTPTVLGVAVLAFARWAATPEPASVTAAMSTVAQWPAGWRRCVLVACMVGVATRVIDHLYQGPVHAAAAAVWGSILLAIYLTYGSVLPLILGHFTFDLVVAGSGWAPDWWWSLLGASVVFAATTVWARKHRSGRQQPTPLSGQEAQI